MYIYILREVQIHALIEIPYVNYGVFRNNLFFENQNKTWYYEQIWEIRTGICSRNILDVIIIDQFANSSIVSFIDSLSTSGKFNKMLCIMCIFPP